MRGIRLDSNRPLPSGLPLCFHLFVHAPSQKKSRAGVGNEAVRSRRQATHSDTPFTTWTPTPDTPFTSWTPHPRYTLYELDAPLPLLFFFILLSCAGFIGEYRPQYAEQTKSKGSQTPHN